MANYRLDGSNLKTVYGVTVNSVSGNLDLLQRKGKTAEDWLDEDGEEEHVLANDIYFKARDLSLQCQIRATSVATMLVNLNALKSVLESSGLHTLYLGTTGVTHSVFFKAGGKVTPATKYGTSDLMAANFRLRLREPDPTVQ